MGAVLSTNLKASSSGSESNSVIHFPDQPTLLPVKNGDEEEVQHVPLRTLIETHCPSLFRPFKPLWYLFKCTLYCVFGDFSKHDRMGYLRRYIKTADGGTIGLDFAPVDQGSVPDDAPVIVVQHGLTGGSYEPYVRAVLSRACKPVSEGGLGYRAVVINFRGYILEKREKQLGCIQHVLSHALLPAVESKGKQSWLKNPTLEMFDECFTRIAGGPAPHFPFKNSEEYYIWGSSDHIVEHITVPFLAINADDDPVVRHVPMDGKGNGKVVMQLTKGGGHLGWFEAGDGRVERWTTQPVLEWLKVMGKVVHEHHHSSPKLYIDGEGWLCEEGRDHIRCKELEECHVVNGNGGETGILQGL
ncbi:hypothetical protein CC1G_04266 [Coprinopsis cinerea okayama7|uniref:AB hydrolase-1 domain-containing protein n=1 Tax=Coprinopsis cinerea (strain Okayama-7 / 130 / ATCC MYA-4618 / FGSC 9003) TaxID=240176 RepID=A8NFH7_COPC7|nr:hypothetical protein CC1G_04266 [Coprinopsis cinerea okayama7\|eukprot:XP_001833287.2 hypothetical protein CC1G_04266 [Coprinopsis cinerea okayama7\